MNRISNPHPSAAVIFFATSVLSLTLTIAALINSDEVNRLTYYFTGILIAIVVTAGFWIYQTKDKLLLWWKHKAWANKYWLSVLLFIGAAILRFWKLGAQSLWLDEYVQAYNSSSGYDITYMAADQQQPPLEYFFENVAIHAFGYYEWVARLSAAVCGTLLIPLIFALGHRLTKSYYWGLFAAAVAALNPWLIGYSQEGRTVSCAVFFFALNLLVIEAVYEDENGWPSLAALTGSTFLYLTSIGFQAPILIACLVAVLAIGGLLARHRQLIWMSGAMIVGQVLYLPLQLNLIRQSTDYLKSPSTNSLSEAFHYILNYDFWVFWSLFNVPPDRFFSLYLLVPIFIAALILSFYNRKKTKHWMILSSIGITSMLFALSSVIIYHVLINWGAAPNLRYVLTVIPLLICGLTLALQYFQPHVGRKITFVIGLVILSALAVQVPKAYFEKYDNWRAIYDFLRSDSSEPAAAFIFAIDKFGTWSPRGFMGPEFYYDGELASRVQLYGERSLFGRSQAEIISKAVRIAGPLKRTLYFVMYNNPSAGENENYQKVARKYPESVNFKNVARLSVLTFKFQGDLRHAVYEMMAKFEAEFGETGLNRNTFETLARLYLDDQDCPKAKLYMEKLDRVAPGESEFATVYEQLRRRIQSRCLN